MRAFAAEDLGAAAAFFRTAIAGAEFAFSIRRHKAPATAGRDGNVHETFRPFHRNGPAIARLACPLDEDDRIAASLL